MAWMKTGRRGIWVVSPKSGRWDAVDIVVVLGDSRHHAGAWNRAKMMWWTAPAPGNGLP